MISEKSTEVRFRRFQNYSNPSTHYTCYSALAQAQSLCTCWREYLGKKGRYPEKTTLGSPNKQTGLKIWLHYLLDL